jgi:hypothetical protein
MFTGSDSGRDLLDKYGRDLAIPIKHYNGGLDCSFCQRHIRI